MSPQKTLYGLKQLPRQWYKRFDEFMLSSNFIRSKHDHCVYFKREKSCTYVFLLLYVDDMLIACQDMGEIQKVKGLLKGEFDMKELGPAKKILGMEITKNRKKDTLFL